jgi:hypothetical protein
MFLILLVREILNKLGHLAPEMIFEMRVRYLFYFTFVLCFHYDLKFTMLCFSQGKYKLDLHNRMRFLVLFPLFTLTSP